MSRMRQVFTLLCLVAAVAGRPGVARAQSDTGVIDGRVFDESKSAVPGVTVTARNVATGFTRSGISGDKGTYRIEFLPPGTYEVTAEMPNFTKAIAKDIIVQVATSTNVD